MFKKEFDDMLKIETCVAAMLALIMVLSLCTCCNKAKTPEDTITEPTQFEWPTDSGEENESTRPTMSEDDRQELERQKKQQINFGQIIFYSPKSDLEITVDSEYFNNTHI